MKEIDAPNNNSGSSEDAEQNTSPTGTVSPPNSEALALAAPEPEPENLNRVTFFPPLQDQRRGWILRILREERVRSVVDIGCGEGELLGCLCNPSRFLCPEPESESESEGMVLDEETMRAVRAEEESELQVTHILGLDIDAGAARRCAAATAPKQEDEEDVEGKERRGRGFEVPRWTALDVQVFCGSLAERNALFVGVDCIVSTEVIEHLPPSVLPAFARTLLGSYRPRLLLLTTPSYAFNARFAPPHSHSHSNQTHGYPDPTGRTARVFRHADHQFEWTPAEFGAWCATAAAEWGYAVEVGGVGRAVEDDRWGRDSELGCATQVAVFRRQDEACSSNAAPSPSLSLSTAEATPKRDNNEPTPHVLLAAHHHAAHPRAGTALPAAEIAARVVRCFEEEGYYCADGWTVWALWVEEAVAAACGGRLRALVGAVRGCAELELRGGEGEPLMQWRVLFAGARHGEALARIEREEGEVRGRAGSPGDEDDGDGLGCGRGADDWQGEGQVSSWASREGWTSHDAIGEGVDWGGDSGASWGGDW